MTPAAAELLLPMFRDTGEMLSLAWSSFRSRDLTGVEVAASLGRAVHKHEEELTERLVAAPREVDGLRFVPAHLQRVADAIQGLLRCLRTMDAEATVFTERGIREMNQLFERSTELLECARDLVLTGNRVLARHVEIESMRFQELASEFARAHEERLVDGVCLPTASSTYLTMLDYLREITRHARRIAERIVPHEANAVSARRYA
jgi:Na+/phosphate symporter